MLTILKRTYRKITELNDAIRVKLRILGLRAKYPNIQILGKTKIGKNCYIVCDDQSSLILKDVTISNNTVIVASRGGKISISSSYIGFNCIITAINNIKIEKHCEIAEFTVIRDQNHNYNFSDTPIAKQGYSSETIHIKENVWIGAKSTILKGVSIEKNSVVAAHALVNKSFTNTALIGGLPARELKSFSKQ